jgi:hypothetical protein
VKIQSGSSTLFWKDFWTEGGLLCHKFPRLFSFALDEDISVAHMAGLDQLNEGFALPMSVEAFQEWQEVSQLITATPMAAQQPDRRTFCWGDKFTPSQFYNFLFAHLPRDAALNDIWKSRALPKLKVFAWLLLMDRLNTRDLMQRKNWHIDSGFGCELCVARSLETTQHLFFDCEFAKQCWDFLDIQWNALLELSQNYVTAKTTFSGPCFFEVFACATWNIWKIRNDLIFNHVPASFARWKVCFQSDLLLHQYKVEPGKVQLLIDWIAAQFL